MIKLLASDLDGTLFYPKDHLHAVPKNNREFLRFLSERKIDILYVSGRNPKVLPYLEKITHKSYPLLGCNGAYLYQGGRIDERRPMDSDKLIDLVEKLRPRKDIYAYFFFDVTTRLHLIFENLSAFSRISLLLSNQLNGAYRESVIHGYHKAMDWVRNNPIDKLMIVFGLGNEGRKRALQSFTEVSKLAGDSFSVVVSGTSLEIMKKGVDKGSGLLRYCQERGIQKDEVLVCGDSGNDIAMLSLFPFSFAMSHATKMVKEKASFVIDSVCDLKDWLTEANEFRIPEKG